MDYFSAMEKLKEEERIDRLEDLIQKWHDEASLLRRQKSYFTTSLAWKAKDEERMDCLEKCANELEAIVKG